MDRDGHVDSAHPLSTADFVNTLVYGENLEILQRFLTDETVDLVYLDPPFSSNREYSLIFRDESGRKSDSQVASFEESWHWGPTPEAHFEYLTNGALHHGRVPHGVSALIGAMRESIRPSPVLAYLVEMATRLVELHRVLKASGSLYLHCDPTASHYLKLVLDAVFGARMFRNEIVWKRSYGHGDSRRSLGRSHDILLMYTKTDDYTLNPFYHAHDPAYLESFFRFEDERGRYKLENLTSPSPRANLTYAYKGYPPPAKGWRVNLARMRALDADDRLHFPRKPTGRIMKKVYLHELEGQPMTDVWTDIKLLSAHDRERLPYPTQKPLALLTRIIEMSTNQGDLVLDPFCGCGTAVEAAHATGRCWIGIDLSNHAIEVIQTRMAGIGVDVRVFDWPTELDGVRRMVEAPGGRHRFEAWGLTRLGAQPVRELGGRGADEGIDGRIPFTLASGRVETIIVSVKSGHIGPSVLRDLKGTVERERAAMGVLLTLQEPTTAMRKEAVAGFYRTPTGESYPRIVVLTVADLLAGRMPELPSRHGVQMGVWQQLPTASRAVTLRPVRAPAASGGATPSTERASAIRAAYSASAAPPPSPAKAKRDPAVPRQPRGSSKAR